MIGSHTSRRSRYELRSRRRAASSVGPLIVAALALGACGGDGGERDPFEAAVQSAPHANLDAPTTTVSPPVTDRVNVVTVTSLMSGQRVTCRIGEGGGPVLSYGLADIETPSWFSSAEGAVIPGDFAIDPLMSMVAANPQRAIKSAALTDAAEAIGGNLGQVVDAAGYHEAGGCILGAASIFSRSAPTGRDLAFRQTYVALKAGDAYARAADSDLAREWYSYAATHPGGDPSARYYADQAASKL